MPSTPCVKPTNNQNPNYMLKALSVENHTLTPTFNMHETEYSLIVPYEVESIKINATAVASVTKITGHGTQNLKVGENAFRITSTAENGTKRVYELTVVREEGQEAIPPSEETTTPTVNTTEYQISSNNTITGIKSFPMTTATFLSKISVANGNAKITDANGNEKTTNVGTGDQVRVYDSTGGLKSTYYIVIYGDTNGDGTVSALDLLRIQKTILSLGSLNGVYSSAADTNKDGNITALDLLQVQKHILNLKSIAQ